MERKLSSKVNQNEKDKPRKKVVDKDTGSQSNTGYGDDKSNKGKWDPTEMTATQIDPDINKLD